MHIGFLIHPGVGADYLHVASKTIVASRSCERPWFGNGQLDHHLLPLIIILPTNCLPLLPHIRLT